MGREALLNHIRHTGNGLVRFSKLDPVQIVVNCIIIRELEHPVRNEDHLYLRSEIDGVPAGIWIRVAVYFFRY
jgi:hypothetical protein